METIKINTNELLEIIGAPRFTQPADALSLGKQLKREGISVAKEDWSIGQLVNVLRIADQAYYNDGESLTSTVRKLYQEIITDKVYDKLENILRKRDPKNKYLNKVGAETPKSPSSHASQRMTKLPFPMASLDKLKPYTANKWLDSINEVVVSNKVDGVSLGIISDGTGSIQLVSRGNGEIGQDVSYLLPYIKSLKKLINKSNKKKFKIRGELVLPQAAFKKFSSEYKNPRNLMSGVLNKGSISPAIKDALFVGYSVIEPKLKPINAFEFLDKLGIATPDWKIIKNPNSEKLTKLLINRKKNSSYDIDGLVITDTSSYESPSHSNPKKSKAYKDPSLIDSAETTVQEVIWNVGKTGSIIPIIQVEPVELCGTTVKKATCHNAEYIKNNKIGPGAVVLLTKGGEIIPYISEVIKPAKKASFPVDIDYKWEGVHIVLDEDSEENKGTSKAIAQRNIKRITSFYRTLGVENVSSGIFERLYEEGYDTIFKVASITVKKLLKISGFKEVSANKVYDEISGALDEVNIADAMYGSSCFNRLLGSRRLEQIVQAIPDFMKLKPQVLHQRISSLSGFNDTTASAFIEGLPLFKEFLPRLEKVANIVYPKKQKLQSKKLEGQNIVFTGFRDNNLSEIIKKNGGIEGSNVSSKTTILVVKDTSSTSSKAEKARNLGVKIMTKDQFERFLDKEIQ